MLLIATESNVQDSLQGDCMKPNKHKFFIFFLLFILQPLHSHSFDQNPALSSQFIPNSMVTKITPRGQDKIQNHAADILNDLGINFSEYEFQEKTIPIPLKNSQNQDNGAALIFKKVKTMLSRWLENFTLNEPKMFFSSGKSQWSIDFKKISIHADENLMVALNKNNGALLTLDVDIKNIGFRSKNGLHLWDENNLLDEQNNPIAKISMTDVNLQVTENKMPLKLKIPIFIKIQSDGQPYFEALPIENNFDQMNIDLVYKNLLMPRIAVSIGNKTAYINMNELNKYVKDQIPTYLTEAKTQIRDFIRNELPKILNDKVRSAFSDTLSKTSQISPPAKPERDISHPDFIEKSFIKKIDLNNSLYIHSWSQVEDPISLVQSLINPKTLTNEVPLFINNDEKNYDFAVSVNRGYINRILELSFKRGYFSKIPTGNNKITLLTPPVVNYVNIYSQKNEEAYFKFNTTISVEFSSWAEMVDTAKQKTWKTIYDNSTSDKKKSFWKQVGLSIKARANETIEIWDGTTSKIKRSIVLKNPIQFQADIIGRLRKNKNSLEIVLDHFDTDTLTIDPQYFSSIGQKVMPQYLTDKFKDYFKEMNEEWKEKEIVLPGKIPLTINSMNLKFDLQKVDVESTGHLILYMNYVH